MFRFNFNAEQFVRPSIVILGALFGLGAVLNPGNGTEANKALVRFAGWATFLLATFVATRRDNNVEAPHRIERRRPAALPALPPVSAVSIFARDAEMAAREEEIRDARLFETRHRTYLRVTRS